MVIPLQKVGSYVLLTRPPLINFFLQVKKNHSFDLHVLSMPPAFILSQDQTLREYFSHTLRYLFSYTLSNPPASLYVFNRNKHRKSDKNNETLLLPIVLIGSFLSLKKNFAVVLTSKKRVFGFRVN